MQSSKEKVGIDVDRKKGERGDSNAILQDHQEQAKGDEKNLVPKVSQTKMGHQQRHDEKRHARADAAALFCHFDADLGEMKHQTLAQDGHSHDVEQYARYPRRALLKKQDDAIEEKIGNWHHQKQEEKREVSRSQGCFPEEKGEASDPDKGERQNRAGQLHAQTFARRIIRGKGDNGG